MSKKHESKKRPNLDISYTCSRELSWLQFNSRVLEEAESETVPLFERLKFVSIFSSNLDEFFMIRVGSLTDIAAIHSKDVPDNKCGWTASQQLEHIYESCIPLVKRRDKVFSELSDELAKNGVEQLSYSKLTAAEKRYIDRWYKTRALPILSPQVVDQHHPFPHLPSGQLYIAARLRFEELSMFGLLPVPTALSAFVRLPDEDSLRYVLTEDILLSKLSSIFKGFRVQSKAIIRVTRNADISPDDDDDDIEIEPDMRQKMKKLLKKRMRLAPVRLEYKGKLHSSTREFLLTRLNLHPEQVYEVQSPLQLGYVFSLESMVVNKDLLYPSWTPQPSPMMTADVPVLPQVLEHDMLLHYPYERMNPFLRLIREASSDPDTVSIKITLYRVARQSKLISYLCDAAENGKEVLVLVELRARFDEENNLALAEQLEHAGCRVIYGIENLKVHSKICLITRQTETGTQYITQIGTGNYNEKTAKQYTDLSLMTSNNAIGEDAANFFQHMALGIPTTERGELLIAPNLLKSGILELIEGEIQKANAGLPSRIIMKFNSLTDRDIIDRLSEASCAGVPIDLIIRGICCLVPSVPNKTENITIRSIVGRFLEHSRIFCFGVGDEEKIYIGSADMMTRNTEKRVEIACPVYDKKCIEKIHDILDIYMKDNIQARIHNSHGHLRHCKRKNGEEIINSQQVLMDEAVKNAPYIP